MKDILQQFRQSWLEQPRKVLGVMTGTSFDGIDIAIATIFSKEKQLRFETLAHTTIEYPKELKNYFSRITSQNQTSVSDISTFNALHPHCIAKAINDFLDRTKIENIDLIGYHGQTIWHQPNPLTIGDYTLSSTFQIGSGAILAQKTNIPVISDFRSADMVYGGQGAPFVPIFDRDIFSDDSQTVTLVNIGGIANITVLSPDKAQPIAYDVGPGNVWLDYISQKYFSLPFDDGGKIAHIGKNSEKLWDKLLQINFLQKPFPKSTGREEFSVDVIESLIQTEVFSPEDILHTLTKFTAYCIATEITLHTNSHNKVYVSGGGLHNAVIMSYLQSFLPHSHFKSTESLGIAPDAKEALCFAYLAWRTFAGLPIALPSITGATKETISGSISFPY